MRQGFPVCEGAVVRTSRIDVRLPGESIQSPIKMFHPFLIFPERYTKQKVLIRHPGYTASGIHRHRKSFKEW
jgi:hypothetical protein